MADCANQQHSSTNDLASLPLCDHDSAIFPPQKIGRLKPLIVDLAVMLVGETGQLG